MTPIEQMLVMIGAVALIFEIIALIKKGWRTISTTMRIDGMRWLSWPFLLGALPYHFWTPPLPWPTPSWGQPTILVIMGMILGRDLFVRTRVSLRTTFWVMVSGCVLGAILWNQG
jgi:hypothetical protein